MIHTAKQLKDKVKNMSGGNSEVAQALISVCSLSNLFFQLHKTTLTEVCSNESKQHHL